MDGLRGWAALSVVCYHFVWELFGIRFPEFRNLVTATLFDGQMAVSLFFCISGYVLTVNGWRGDKQGVRRLLIKRYARLSIPIAACTAIVLMLMTLGLTAHQAANRIVTRDNWLGTFLDFDPSLIGAVFYPLVTVYLIPRAGAYNPFLWTMIFELWGSLLVLGLCIFEKAIRWPYTILVALALLLLTIDAVSPAACFPAGAAFALAKRDGFIRDMPGTLPALAIVLIAAGALQHDGVHMTATTVLSCVGFALVLASAPARRFLDLPVSRFLGAVSFPLYLVQFPVLISVSSALIVWADAAGVLNPITGAAIALGSVLLSLLAAIAFLPVERFTAWAGNAAIRKPA